MPPDENEISAALADEKLFKEMRSDFVNRNQTKYSEIVNALNAGDMKTAHRLVHTLKTNAAHIGKSSLYEIAAEIESLLKEKTMPSPEDRMNILENELCSTLKELEPFLQKGNYQLEPIDKKNEMHETDQKKIIAQLEELLEKRSPECLDIIDKLRLMPDYRELIQQIENWDFSEASTTLTKLKEKKDGQ
jgi:HPt (histidine-containing phosphotransfer) domain-containing protein